MPGYEVTREQLAAISAAYPTTARILEQFAKSTAEGGLVVYPIGFFTGTHEKLNDRGMTVGLAHFYGAITSSGMDEIVFDLAFEQGVEHPGYSPMVPPPSVRVTLDSSHGYSFDALSPDARETLDRQWAVDTPRH